MGVLSGLRIVEMAGIGPAPFAGMMLADHGAEVLCIDRLAPSGLGIPAAEPELDPLGRGKRSVALDLQKPTGAAAALDLIVRADAVIEGFRPGVMERLGLGPDPCLQRNPKLVYGRMTGFGQTGPLRDRAGHDIDYIALTGVLDAIGPAGHKPVPPLNLVGDFGGGGMMLAFGVVAALLNVQRGGQGQVVDAAMTEGASLLGAMFHGLAAMGLWDRARGGNLLDGGAPFYDTYETADGKFIAIGAIEPKFYAELLRGLGLDPDTLPEQMDRARWPALKASIAAAVKRRSQAAWVVAFDGTDACVQPVLSFADAAGHPHNRARDSFVQAHGLTQPAPAPRFMATPGAIGRAPPAPGADTASALADWGLPPAVLAALRSAGAVP
ncbi:MAG: CoA transferase [Rhodospirillales bacterium]|nr:CoA transferase [Rhodospirillales bacterium]